MAPLNGIRFPWYRIEMFAFFTTSKHLENILILPFIGYNAVDSLLFFSAILDQFTILTRLRTTAAIAV